MEIIKSYSEETLTGYGIPTLIITGWTDITDIYHERFLIFETFGRIERSYKRINTNKDDWEGIQKYLKKPNNEEELIETFMDEALRGAKGDLFGMMLKVAEEKASTLPMNSELVENNCISTIMYLKNKFPDELNRIEQSTRQEKLKALIKIANGITYYSTDDE